jgi:cytochrome c5
MKSKNIYRFLKEVWHPSPSKTCGFLDLSRKGRGEISYNLFKKIIFFSLLFFLSMSLHASPDLKKGRSIYKDYCSQCHETGSGGSPRVTDKKNWAKRLTQPEDTLINHAYQGYRLMPPRGNCYDCTREDIANAFAYMREKEIKQ